jgi:DNA polymerase I-like protein with 3'-5' exonuclease and polymerase domains
MPLRTLTVRTVDHLKELVSYYKNHGEFVFDVESMGKHRGVPAHNRVVWLSMATYGGRADVIPFGHPHGELLRAGTSFREAQWDPRHVGKRGQPLKKQVNVQRAPAFGPAPQQLRPHEVFEALEPLFFSDRVKVAHQVKFDIGSITKYYDGNVPPMPYGDTFAAAKLLLEEKEAAGLKPLVVKYFEHKYDTEDVGKCIENHGFDKVARYAYLDAKYTWEFWLTMVPALDNQGLSSVYELEMKVQRAVIDMELSGVPVDETPMGELGETLSNEIREVTKRIWSAAGKKLDLNKTLDVRELVYDIQGHKPFAYTEKTKDLPDPEKVPSTEKAVLEVYVGDPVVKDLMEWRRLTKLFSTYIGNQDEHGVYETGLMQFVVNGRIHTNLKPFGAATGRFSSATPNLQNIPARGEAGSQIRRLFIAPPGHKLVVADYSQIEYRVLAHFTGDPTLTTAFENGWDPHQATAALLLHKDMADITKEERDRGKTTNFAQVYGAGAAKVAAAMGVTKQEAYRIFEEYERRFPDVVSWKKEAVKEARRRNPPCVYTISGRRRILRALTWSDDGMRSYAERQVVNTICQGTAADIMKMAIVKVHEETPPSWQKLLTVHDELMLAVPDEEADEAKNMLEKLMLSVNPLTVPLEVDGGIGDSWSEAK